ncbi:hypothetical protein D1872_122640 [compost metagenome]
MKGFEEFSIMTNEKKEGIWNKAIFVFDANVLLNLYRYTEETANDLLSIMTMMKERIWIPHQVALEYNHNRISTILQQTNSYNLILKDIDNAYREFTSALKEKLKNYENRHPGIEIDKLFEKIEMNICDVRKTINSAKELHPDYLKNDPFYEKIDSLFDGKVGENPFTQQSELETIFEEGHKRYENSIPPGYKDAKDKKGKIRVWNNLIYKNEYGDLLVWKQILLKAKQEKTSVILITDDNKEDWWQIVSGKTIGPRIELLREFKNNDDANEDFYMYRTYQFMKIAQEHINDTDVKLSSIKEVEELKSLGIVNNENFISAAYSNRDLLLRKISNQNKEKLKHLYKELNAQSIGPFSNEYYAEVIPFDNLVASDLDKALKALMYDTGYYYLEVVQGDLSPEVKSSVKLYFDDIVPRIVVLDMLVELEIFSEVNVIPIV